MDSPHSPDLAAALARIIVLVLLGAVGVTAVMAFATNLADQEHEDALASARSLRDLVVRSAPPPVEIEVLTIPTAADCELIAPPPPPVVCPPPPPVDARSESGLRDLGEGLSRQDIEIRCRTYLNFAPRGDTTTVFRAIGKE